MLEIPQRQRLSKNLRISSLLNLYYKNFHETKSPKEVFFIAFNLKLSTKRSRLFYNLTAE